MQVKILKNLIYKGEVYAAGKEIEIDTESARELEKRGAIKILSETFEAVDAEFTPAASLPPLETGKKKK